MKVPKVCAVKGPAGEEELAGLVQFAVKGWNIAFMDPDLEKGYQLQQKLEEEFNIIVNIVNDKRKEKLIKADIEGFFYHGHWDNEEDVDIYWSFIHGKYGGINHII